MCEMNMVTLQQLEISKQLASSTKYVTLTFKTKDIDLTLSTAKLAARVGIIKLNILMMSRRSVNTRRNMNLRE